MDRLAPSDEELLSAWAAGDKIAGTHLVDRHFALVSRFFRNKVGVEIEDLIQQTFLGCVEACSRYEGRSSFKTFLLGIARNQLYTYYRGRQRDASCITISSMRDRGTSPTGKLARRDAARLLAAALREISLDAQVILELAYWEGLAGPEIAAVLDVPVNTVYARLRRARETLRTTLGDMASGELDGEHAWHMFSAALPGGA